MNLSQKLELDNSFFSSYNERLCTKDNTVTDQSGMFVYRPQPRFQQINNSSELIGPRFNSQTIQSNPDNSIFRPYSNGPKSFQQIDQIKQQILESSIINNAVDPVNSQNQILK